MFKRDFYYDFLVDYSNLEFESSIRLFVELFIFIFFFEVLGLEGVPMLFLWEV